MTFRTPRPMSARASAVGLGPMNPIPTIFAANCSVVTGRLDLLGLLAIHRNDEQRKGPGNGEQARRDEHAFVPEDRLHDPREDRREGDEERAEPRADRV